MTEVRQYGVDRTALARLVNDAALDGEAQRLGNFSTGDDAAREQVMATPAFQGSDGSFNRETYAAALDRAGLRPADFEELLRREATASRPRRPVRRRRRPTPRRRPSSASSASGGASNGCASTPPSPEPIPAPADADLAAEHDAHAADRYTRPETRQVAYASVTPRCWPLLPHPRGRAPHR